jgi:predicted nucleotidyltransferase
LKLEIEEDLIETSGRNRGFENHKGGRMNQQISIPKDQIASFCRERGIRRLAIFGSALRPDFKPDSDIDVLVEFEPGHIPGFLGMARYERELSAILGGRKVDLRTPEDLSRYFRQSVLDEAEVQYAQG